jgi:hypothetical protein
VTLALRRRVFEAYGLSYPQPPKAFDVDHLIPLALGGSNDIANLWPEPMNAMATEKNNVEDALYRKVCVEGTVKLAEAQLIMASDWRQFKR